MKLFLENGLTFEGESFGAPVPAQGEVVFSTGMTGYLETLTDPSYFGQIIVFTFPLIGNYGTFPEQQFRDSIDDLYESNHIWARGVIVTENAQKYSHYKADSSLAQWLKKHNIPALEGVDTRALTRVLREKGTLLGAIDSQKPKKISDPLNGRFVPEVSPSKKEILEPPHKSIEKTIAFIDCGAKNGIFRNFLDRGVRIIRCGFDQDPFELDEPFDGIFFSNGPGDPEKMTETIEIARKALQKNTPLFGICLGNQILALAAGGKTKRMKYGHRSANQPVKDLFSNRCFITTQNHGYEVEESSLPKTFVPWMKNLNDGSNEGIRHTHKDIFSVQFHPEGCAGPQDAQYLFDEFIKVL